jgi:hypothetical protein
MCQTKPETRARELDATAHHEARGRATVAARHPCDDLLRRADAVLPLYSESVLALMPDGEITRMFLLLKLSAS